jgi:hypothetical protein
VDVNVVVGAIVDVSVVVIIASVNVFVEFVASSVEVTVVVV